MTIKPVSGLIIVIGIHANLNTTQLFRLEKKVISESQLLNVLKCAVVFSQLVEIRKTVKMFPA